MTNKIIAVQGNNLSKLNPITDTSIFLASRGEKLGYKIFYYDPKNLSIINNKVIAKGDYIKINYLKKRERFFFQISDVHWIATNIIVNPRSKQSGDWDYCC